MVAILSAGNQNIYFKLKVTIFYLFWHQFSLVLLSDQVDGDGGLLRGRGGAPLMVLALADGLRADLKQVFHISFHTIAISYIL